MYRMNIFTKVVSLILFLFTPILFLYFFSNYVSNEAASTEIKRLNKEQLLFFVNQLETNMEHLSSVSISLLRDPNVRDLKNIHFIDDPFRYIQMKEAVSKTIELQKLANHWESDIVVFSPESEELLSTSSSSFNIQTLDEHQLNHWIYHTITSTKTKQDYFSWYTVDPWLAQKNVANANLMIGVSFSEEHLINMLDQFKESGREDPFFYHSDYSPIVNRTANASMIQKVIEQLPLDKNVPKNGEQIVEYEKEKYLLSYVQSEKLGWYLVDYVPLKRLLLPIQSSQKLFYISISVLLIAGIIAAFMLYRHVHIPITKLIHGVQSIHQGSYSTRISELHKNEFGYLIQSFNEMAEQIQYLFEKIYEEKIRAKEATLKQLQSQINPHFLYNCLFFIKNMAKLGKEKALIEMIHNLSEYYRYTTRVDKEIVTVKDEIDFVQNYLNIHTLRMERIQYHISIPDEMLKEKFLRLTLQPIVENAIVHGIEPKMGEGFICITGKKEGDQNQLIVEDNGLGLGSEQLAALKEQLSSSVNKGENYGIWNVRQRLLLQYGKSSGIKVTSSKSGGLRVSLFWSSNGE